MNTRDDNVTRRTLGRFKGVARWTTPGGHFPKTNGQSDSSDSSSSGQDIPGKMPPGVWNSHISDDGLSRTKGVFQLRVLCKPACLKRAGLDVTLLQGVSVDVT